MTTDTPTAPRRPWDREGEVPTVRSTRSLEADVAEQTLTTRCGHFACKRR
jgi:hypothetical protein